ncbi:MAG: RNA pseudouridine synthase [Bacteroidaceae bacterium]|nr:RNA pseudouridine synthase [Bacteroidaceae bacterium]
MISTALPGYVHPLALGAETLPAAFTYPFRYTAHPLCERAAAVVAEEVKRMGFQEGKMFGVLVVSGNGSLSLRGDLEGHESSLFFLAAYSGQLWGSYDYPWFVPPVVDYLDPNSHFQLEQKEIVEMSRQLEEMKLSEERLEWQRRVAQLRAEREAAVAEAKRVYAEGKRGREELKIKREKDKREKLDKKEKLEVREDGGEELKIKREKLKIEKEKLKIEGRNELKIEGEEEDGYLELIRESQRQKADIQRAKQLHKQEIAELEARLTEHNAAVHELYEERKRRSEALQQWLFGQFDFLNAKGERKNLQEIFGPHLIPSGAGECCAPKLLQAAYSLGLKPVAMAEFWLGPSKPGRYRQPGAFFPACRSKCHPILGHMLQGLTLDPDPAAHYEQALEPVRVLWEDEYLAVVYKPQGWVSIPGKSDQPCLLDAVERLCPGVSGSVIVHRLDQDTSGVMVVAKNARVHHDLSRQFELREVKKRYVALLEQPTLSPGRGVLREDGGGLQDEGRLERESPQERMPERFSISLPLGPDLENLPRQRVDFEEGKEAVTEYEVLGEETRRVCRCTPATDIPQTEDVAVTRVAFYPHTGRTHQLRVHAASHEGLGTPILGDRLYGRVADRLYLHAEAIDFEHPVTHERLHFEVQAPF